MMDDLFVEKKAYGKELHQNGLLRVCGGRCVEKGRSQMVRLGGRPVRRFVSQIALKGREMVVGESGAASLSRGFLSDGCIAWINS